jgi:hypothetical protein
MKKPVGEKSAPDGHSFRVTAMALLSTMVISLTVQFGPVADSPIGQRLSAVYAAIWPQGWQFFINLDTVDSVAIYRLEVHESEPAEVSRPADSRWWGLSRVGETEFIIGTRISETVPDSYWQTCAMPDIADCSATMEHSMVFNVEEPAVPATWCGMAMIVVERPGEPDIRTFALVSLPCAA